MRVRARYQAAIAIALSLAVYAPLLRSYFYRDDFIALSELTNWPLGRFLTMNWSGHLVLVRNAFYAGITRPWASTRSPTMPCSSRSTG